MRTISSLQLPSSYKVPKQYIDCSKLLAVKLHGPSGNSSKQLTTKQKLKFKKKFFLDETVKSFKDFPSPNKYLEKYTTERRYKSQNTFITKPLQSEKDLGKRPTWIEDIQRYQKKYNPPSVGKYDLLHTSDFNVPQKNISIQKLMRKGSKLNYFDNPEYLSNQVPGPGSHNPHKSVPKLKVNMMDSKAWLKKHKQDSKMQQKRLNLTKTSSFSYSPVKDKTFDSISKKPKKEATLMKITNIDKRQGKKVMEIAPGPGQHNILNKWATQTFQRQKIIGKLNIFSKTSRSLPVLKVYH